MFFTRVRIFFGPRFRNCSSLSLLCSLPPLWNALLRILPGSVLVLFFRRVLALRASGGPGFWIFVVGCFLCLRLEADVFPDPFETLPAPPFWSPQFLCPTPLSLGTHIVSTISSSHSLILFTPDPLCLYTIVYYARPACTRTLTASSCTRIARPPSSSSIACQLNLVRLLLPPLHMP